MSNNSKGYTKYHMASGFVHLVILFVIVVLASLLFAPIPQNNPKDDFYCMSLDCPRPGWSLGTSLAQQLLDKANSKYSRGEHSTVPIKTDANYPTPTPIPTKSHSQTNDGIWKPYSHPSIGSVEYPSNWSVRNNNYSFTLSSDDASISFYLKKGSPILAQSLQEWFDKLSTTAIYDGASEILERKETTISNSPAIQLKTKFNTETVNIYTLFGDHFLRVTIDPADSLNSEINQILSSFEFTN